MTFYLRDSSYRTLLCVELWVKKEQGNEFIELDSHISIDRYSKFLLENIEHKNEIINVFSEMEDLRGWLWETYFIGGKNNPSEINNVQKELTEKLLNIRKQFGFYFVTD